MHCSKEGEGAEVLQGTTPGPRGGWLGQDQLEYTLNLPKFALKLPKIAFSRPQLRRLKVTSDLRGCPPGKNSYARHFKGKHGKLYIVESLINIDFEKKI